MSECQSNLLLRFKFEAYAARAPPNFLCSKTKTKVEVIVRLRDKVKEQAMQMREGR